MVKDPILPLGVILIRHYKPCQHLPSSDITSVPLDVYMIDQPTG